MARTIRTLAGATMHGGQAQCGSADNHSLPDDSVSAFITDPPYYDAVPYSDLLDFFYVCPKNEECIVDEVKAKDKAYYERTMAKAMAEARRVLVPEGVGVVVFAHKTTSGWEAQLQSMIDAGLMITASWPIDTEMGSRMRAQGSAALASSVHLVCRPRENPDGSIRRDDVGDWRSVLSDLPTRIHEWMPRLAEEGVVGADAIFACLGPALEIFSRYSRVEKASGEVVTLREYLEQVWAAVSTEALSMIFRDADAAGLESDARFTAIVLWTLGAGGSASSESGDGESDEVESEDEEDESPKGKVAKGGYTLEYDAARKIAQGLGVNLEQIDSVVEVKGDKARLRPVSERAAALFGKAEKTEAATKKRGKKATQKNLFDKDAEEGGGTADTVTIGEGAAATPGVTALDRVHQAMLLFASGRADALKRFIVEDGVGGDARFWKLAQSLSALYPAGSDEKRWVDGVLARKKSFGF
jgi:adenine-specific DNA methylase